RKYNIKTAFRTQNTLRQHLFKVKPTNEEQASKNCIYSITCECRREYIGETKRPLKVRISEHKKNTIKGDIVNSKLAKHAWENDHNFQWNEAKIIHKESHFYKGKFIEGALIKLNENPISQSSHEIRPLWLNLIKKHFSNKNPPPSFWVNRLEKVDGRAHPMILRSRPRS
ncbi:GIY-YIG nuclease family protein, partial [Klebsiella pneumoniae]|uniref:GIY-YIG nuclease family protein n=1 Tax=Klebsiella pneumoniae TaxID=573 RepID=UPI001C8F49F4